MSCISDAIERLNIDEKHDVNNKIHQHLGLLQMVKNYDYNKACKVYHEKSIVFYNLLNPVKVNDYVKVLSCLNLAYNNIKGDQFGC